MAPPQGQGTIGSAPSDEGSASREPRVRSKKSRPQSSRSPGVSTMSGTSGTECVWAQSVAVRMPQTSIRPEWPSLVVAWLAEDEAAVGAERLPGERGRAVGREEGHGGRGVGGGQPTLEGLPVDGSVELDVGVDRA
jgi:hypothetical protein